LRAAAADKVVLFIHVIQDDTSLTFILVRMYAGKRLFPVVFHAAAVFARLKSFFWLHDLSSSEPFWLYNILHSCVALVEKQQKQEQR